ncbi:hypothetical protein EFT38_09030 [Latilactobacillus curvatus]|uniref:putative phage abortive infection protein n=1 Tax=Latilactobacillus curvatus TaxID=28038 RepID=UPI0020A23B4B|nr:putative phage abortive infection protein [Latilactobacillus curvatus]MCT3359708.1 hypothetical protein [Latilactobacillus curvatus]UTB76003.1 hypothetical protein A4W74_04595 [Latilactobacillus curvatus]
MYTRIDTKDLVDVTTGFGTIAALLISIVTYRSSALDKTEAENKAIVVTLLNLIIEIRKDEYFKGGSYFKDIKDMIEKEEVNVYIENPSQKVKDKRKELFNRVFDDLLIKHEVLGQFLRCSFRNIKFINDNFSGTEHENYMGILRTQLSESDLLLLFYDAEYATRGEFFQRELPISQLLGKRGELPEPGNSELKVMHFSTDKLIWEDDYNVIYNKYRQKK